MGSLLGHSLGPTSRCGERSWLRQDWQCWAPDTYHQGSASTYSSPPWAIPPPRQRVPRWAQRAVEQPPLNSSLILLPTYFPSWIPGGAQAIYARSEGELRCSLAAERARGGFGGTTSTHRARLPSPWKHERHFRLFRIFIFRVFFLLVHARLSFIYRE